MSTIKKSDLVSLIKEVYRVLEGIDDEIEGEPEDGDWIRGDTGGIKYGGTGMPHGYGYPNAPKRRRKFDRNYIQKVVRIDHVSGSDEGGDPTNAGSYPLFVTLYDVTRRMGGHEEGGWWYDSYDQIKSIKVNNYKEGRKAAVALLHSISNADLNGKPLIILEKEEGHLSKREPPSYS